MNNTRLVIIHDTDGDGIAAAWCIDKGFKDEYSEVLLIPQRAGVDTIPEGLLETDSVYMVDRTYPWDTLISLSQQVFSVTVIDHHKSAMNRYTETEAYQVGLDSQCVTYTASSIQFDYSNITVKIDTTHSACMLAHWWVMEHGTDPDTSVDVPWFISYIEDRDIWKWELPNSKEINAGMHYYGHTFERYDAMNSGQCLVETTKTHIEQVGAIVLQTQLNIIKSIAHGPTVAFKQLILEECWTTGMPPKRVPCDDRVLNFAILCCPFTLISDLGSYCLNYSAVDDIAECASNGKIAKPFEVPDVVLCYNETDLGFTYSIRSKHDMIWLAKMFGGGGHPAACGFSSSVPPAKILEVVKFKLANPDAVITVRDHAVELEHDLVSVGDPVTSAFSDLPL